MPEPISNGSGFSSNNGTDARDIAQLQQRLPDYEIISLAGRGGMGSVYKARQKSLRRMVAIKVLPPELSEDELRFPDRFQGEAETMANLSHPGIVAVHDFGNAGDGLLYFVMEFIDGTDVARRIERNGALPVDEALRITRAVCDALDYAHRHGVIHRDIKPANVLIDGEGRVKVADFGLAKVAGHSQQSGITRTNVAMGTQEFAAPEQLTPGAAVDHRADIYSLGVMLYQMLTGEIPRVMFKLPSRSRSELGTRFDALICKALETNPEDRFQSVEEFRQALDAGASRAAKGENALAGAQTSHRGPSRAVFASAAAGIAICALGGWFFLGHRHGHAALPSPEKITTITPSLSPSTLPHNEWIKLLDTPEAVARSGVNGLELKNGWLTVPPERLYLSRPAGGNGKARDMAFRVTVRPPPNGRPVAAVLRAGGDLEFFLDVHRDWLTLRRVKHLGSSKRDDTDLGKVPLDLGQAKDGALQLEVSIQGNLITIMGDGARLMEVRDDSAAGTGGIALVAPSETKGGGKIKDLALRLLDESPAASITKTQDRTIDLLPLVDVKRDASSSVWGVAADGAVRSMRDRKAGRLEFPYTPPAEYDFEIEFTVEDGDSGYVTQVLPVPGHWLDWRLLPPPAFGPTLDGVEPGNGLRTEGIGKLNRLKPGDRHRSVVEVRRNSLRAVVDGTEIALYTGDFKRLADPVGVFKLRDTTHVGVGVLDVGMLIHKAVVREVSGTTEAKHFRPLFDGKSLDGWLSLNGVSPPNGWRVVDGTMTGKPFSAVMTREEFGDLELTLEWRVNPQGNGGVFYRVAEDGMVDHPLHAVEFNLMDENISAPPFKQCGAAFDVKPPSEKAAHPAGEWNTARLFVEGTRVEQWINDKLVCRYDMTDPSVKEGMERAGIGGGFAAVKKGRIALQDWTGEVFYRNVRVRELPGGGGPH